MTSNKLRVIPLGGLGAIGKNMMVIEYGDSMLLIDAGLMFPDEEMLGIDLVLPDFTYVVENRHKLEGIILTHGHEDHVGALPYLLREVNVPVMGTRLTLGLVNGKLGEHGLQGKVQMEEIAPGVDKSLGPFQVEFLSVCHSIPDGVGLAVRTPAGIVVHSGDFKLDDTPVDGRRTAVQRFAELGDEGVLLFLSDSTNADSPGFTAPERSVGETLDTIFAEAPGRVIVASFASHIHRIQQVVDTAARHGRNLAVVGRSMTRNVNIAQNLGYLSVPEGLIVKPQHIAQIPSEALAVLSTGSQGEPMSALARMAIHDHQWMDVGKGDTVVISARPVPGNEKSVSRTINRLFAAGAEVIYESRADVHVSGHAAKEELRTLLDGVKPRFFMPIHGEYRHQHFHAQIALSSGVPQDHIFVMENGDVLETNGETAALGERVQAGMIFVDGLATGDFRDVILRDRHHLSTDGIVTVVVAVRAQDGLPAAEPEVTFRGFVYSGDLDDLAEAARREVLQVLHSDKARPGTDVGVLKSRVHDGLQRFIRKETRKRPMIMPVIVEV